MKCILGIVCLFFVTVAEAQQISVQSFRKLENDLSARTEKRLDQNGDVCALVKVVAPEQGFYFDGDGNGIVAVERKIGEYWVYIPYGSRYLTVKHDKLGVLRAYAYPERIEKACVYEMVLTTGRVKTIVEEEIGGQWLVIAMEPKEARVYIDDVYEAGESGQVQKFLPLGRHTYRVEHALYYPEAGQVEISPGERTELTVHLRPAFGYVKVMSEPESGAQVLIDGEEVGVTPYCSDRLKSGNYRIEVLKAMYTPIAQHVTVTEGDTIPVCLKMSANYATLTVKTDAFSEIWVNKEKKGQGQWSGRLSAGMYVLEGRRPSHQAVRQSVELKAGEVRTFVLNPPVPIYGTLNISSTPGGAEIWLDGKSYGTTPQIVKDILIGEHLLELRKPGCASLTQSLTVEEGKILPIHLTLSAGRRVTIQTDREGDRLYIDETPVGNSPQTLELAYGNHKVRAVRGGKISEKQIAVKEARGDTTVLLGFGLLEQVRWSFAVGPEQRQILSRMIENMVEIEGGSFRMGATPEQGSEASENEKPVHLVTLSDYYIGKYQLTQAEWRAVMGTNPSNFKGDDLPVLNVNWADCQEFLPKLNAWTGLNFKLPTEAQWEYAARGGRKSEGYKYAGSNNLNAVGWNAENSWSKPHAVGQKQANELGLYDMSGNVWEWCQDWYGKYNSDSQTDPQGPDKGPGRVSRGGSWLVSSKSCRTSSRYNQGTAYRNDNQGFRLAL